MSHVTRGNVPTGLELASGSQQSTSPSGGFHTLATKEVARLLSTDLGSGLSDEEARRRRRRNGPNTLAAAKNRSALAILADQFKSLLVALLLAATMIAFMFGENIEGAAVLVVIVLNALVGFLTEWKADRALNALKQQAAPSAHVLRDSKERQIPAAELVEGDIVILDAGDRVPADGRLLESVRLQVDEAALTGESHAVTKTTEPLSDENLALGDRINMVYLGTVVTDGRGKLIVTAIGSRTEMGRIGTLIEEAVDRATPLEHKLQQLGNALIFVVFAICAVIILVGWLRGNSLLSMVEIGISLAIAAVPEGLPAVTTMTLAIGMQRMARMGALIRRLPAVETLGSTTVICTDKTGTLTRNEMTVQQYQLAERHIEVSGIGYSTAGQFTEQGRPIDPRADAQLALALRIGALCSDAALEKSQGALRVLGDPTEGALLVAAAKAGMKSDMLDHEYPRLSEVPFSSDTKRMATVHSGPGGRASVYVKGGPAVVADACGTMLTPTGVYPLDAEERQRILAQSLEMAGRALRVLALAYRELQEGYRDEDLMTDLVLVGMVGMIDPLRDEAKQAIEVCRQAGIRTVMITGDQEATAAEIGRQLGLDRDLKGHPLRTAHGRELTGMTADAWQRVVEDVGVFARVSPEHKLRIVEALQRDNEVVAMTGDGVNDAPALKKADIGIAMGIKGTEVAKEAVAMIITDDNFATIVGAVEQGRIIFANILRFVHYLFSCNLAEILVVFIALLIGWPAPLGAMQILWLNMLTDVSPALALALEPSSPGVMSRHPRDPQQPLMTPQFVWLITWQGLLLSAVTLLAFFVGLRWYDSSADGVQHAMTLAFMTLALTQVFHAFNARSPRQSAFTARLFTNAWLWVAVCLCVLLQVAAVYVGLLQAVLRTTALARHDWVIILGCSLMPVAVVEFVKLCQRKT